ncbi:MAG: hypothetical protein Q9192_002137 [Flavoplaca navasiana]
MSDHEDASHHSNIWKDHTKPLTHSSASECTSSSTPVLNQSQTEQPQPAFATLPQNNPPRLESEWNFIGPELSLHPSLTTPLGHHTAGLEQANLSSPSTPPSLISESTTHLKGPSHQVSLKRSRSSVSSSQAQTALSSRTEPTSSQIALRRELDRQDLELREIARARAADEESDSDSDKASTSCSHSDNSQLDMATNPETVRGKLTEHFMFIDRGHLKNDLDFKKMILKVMETDRTSAVSEGDIKRFDETYKTYKNSNEATLVHALLPIMMGDKLTSQGGEGDLKERSFIDHGVIFRMDQLFNEQYCLPHSTMNISGLPLATMRAPFDSTACLTTPKPDFVYGIDKDKLPSRPIDLVPSEQIAKLLDRASIREVFFVWENKSGGGNIMKCGDDALKDTAALILARRQLYEIIGRPSSPGIDKDTYMFAAINNNGRIEFFIAYVWLPKDLSYVEFCMDSIGGENFTINELKENRTILPCLRRPLHNIIEWGSVIRMAKVKQFYQKLYQAEREMSEKTIKEAKDKEAEANKSNKKQKTGK